LSRRPTLIKKADKQESKQTFRGHSDHLGLVDQKETLTIKVGDFAQLPPVDKGEDAGGSTFCFDAAAFKDGDFKTVQLTEIFRTNEPEFMELLHRARFGKLGPDDVDRLKRRITQDVPETVPRLFPLRKTVEQFNQTCLDLLQNKTGLVSFTSQRVLMPDTKEAIEMADSMGFEETVVLIKGAMVMLTINLNPTDGWVNGTTCIVHELSTDRRTVVLERISDKRRTVVPKMVKPLELDTVEGSVEQFPLRLAWAITIHKSQGATLESVAVDVGKNVFSHGQVDLECARL